jgi:radical SAM protein with 4Fe4S-binding SPASM domain
LSRRLGKTVEVSHVSPGHTIQGDLNLFGLPIHVFSTNYDLYGSDRAGSVSLLKKQVGRMAPCDRPFNDFTVSYDGTIFPCCQMFADNVDHCTDYAIGNLKDFPDIFTAYASTAMVEWRKHLLRYSPKARPCDTCSENNNAGTREEHQERNRIYRNLVGPIQEQPVAERMKNFLRHILVKPRN